MTAHIVVSVRDRAADTFGPPYVVPHAGVAVRSFTNEVNRADEKNPLYMNPEDFELWELGSFEDSTGRFTTTPPSNVRDQTPYPHLLVVAKDVKKSIQ